MWLLFPPQFRIFLTLVVDKMFFAAQEVSQLTADWHYDGPWQGEAEQRPYQPDNTTQNISPHDFTSQDSSPQLWQIWKKKKKLDKDPYDLCFFIKTKGNVEESWATFFNTI